MGQLRATKLSLNVCDCSLQTTKLQGENAMWDTGPGKMNVLRKTSLYVFPMCYSQLFLNNVNSLTSHQRDSGQPCEHWYPAWLESWWGPLVRHIDGWDFVFFSFCKESPLVGQGRQQPLRALVNLSEAVVITRCLLHSSNSSCSSVLWGGRGRSQYLNFTNILAKTW